MDDSALGVELSVVVKGDDRQPAQFPSAAAKTQGRVGPAESCTVRTRAELFFSRQSEVSPCADEW